MCKMKLSTKTAVVYCLLMGALTVSCSADGVSDHSKKMDKTSILPQAFGMIAPHSDLKQSSFKRLELMAQAAENGKLNRGGDGGSVLGADGGRGGRSGSSRPENRKLARESDALIYFCVDFLKSNGHPKTSRYRASDCIGYFEWLTASHETRDGGVPGEDGPSVDGGVGGVGGIAGEGPGGGFGGAGGAGVAGGQGGAGGAGGAGK